MGIASFFSQDCEIFLVDVSRELPKGLRMVHSIVSDGCRLPFRDKAFDVVISVDTVEHIPKSVRHNFYSELKRVCKKKVVLTHPMQSDDGVFLGGKYDITFQYLYERNYGVKEPNTAQHIAAGHPTLEEIKREFSDPVILGYKNCEVWLKYMLFSRKPLLGLFCGPTLLLTLEERRQQAPLLGCNSCVKLKIIFLKYLILLKA